MISSWQRTIIECLHTWTNHFQFVLGSKKFYDSTAENASWLLEECVDSYGRPRQILTDGGMQLYLARKNTKKRPLARFTKHCKKLGIDHMWRVRGGLLP